MQTEISLKKQVSHFIPSSCEQNEFINQASIEMKRDDKNSVREQLSKREEKSIMTSLLYFSHWS